MGKGVARKWCRVYTALLLLAVFLFSYANAVPAQCWIDSGIGSDANDCSAPGDPTKTCNSFSRAYALGCACIFAEPGTYDGVDNRNIAATYCPKIVPTTPGTILINLENMGRFVDYNFANTGGLTQLHHTQITNGLVTAGDGGGIRTRGCNLLLNQTTFWHNRARGGGAVYAWTSGASSTLDVTVLDSLFRANRADQGTNATLRRGGAICVQGNPLVQGGTTLSVDPTLFEDNFASVRGGAISLLDTFATISDTTFRNNTASPPASTGATGGAVFVEGSMAPESSKATFDNCTFVENKALNAGNHGGGVASDAEAVTIFRSSFFCSNEALGLNGRGGAIHADNGVKQMFASAETVFQCNVASVTANNHVSPTSSCLYTPFCAEIPDNGGACDACVGGPTFPASFSPADCWVSVGDFGNPVGSDANPGTVAMPFATLERAYFATCKSIHVFGGRYFGVKNRGQAISYGPVVSRWPASVGSVTVDMEFLDRHVTVHGTIDEAVYREMSFVNGAAPSPGGAFLVIGLIVGARPGLELDSIVCENNEAPAADGGCVYIENGLLDVKDSLFACNSADLSGGAIYIFDDTGIVKDNVTQLITRSTFRWNQAIFSGGAIHVLQVERFELTHSLLEYNRVPAATSDGGALTIRDTWQSEVHHNVFACNTAERGGGAVENLPAGGANIVTFVNDTFCNNVAVRSTGGAYRRTGGASEVFMSVVSHFQCNAAFSFPTTDDTSPTVACGEDAPPSCVSDPDLDSDSDGICDRCDTRVNPGCGLSVAIVLPQTSTIDATEAAALIGVLKDWLMSNHTEMTVAFYGYNQDASIISTYADLTFAHNVVGLKKRLDSLVFPGLGGGVNWADVLNLIGDTTAGGAPDYVIFFADVQPNFPGSIFAERTAAAAASAALQAAGARVIGVDLGSAQDSIDDISGPNLLNCTVQAGIDFFDLASVAEFDSLIHGVVKDQLCCPADRDSCGFCGKVLPKEARCNGCNACVNATVCPASTTPCVAPVCVTNATFPSGFCGTSNTTLNGMMCDTVPCMLMQLCLNGECQAGIPAEFVDEPTGCRDTGAAAPCTFDMCMPTVGGFNCTHTLKTLVADTKCLPGYNATDPTHDPRFWCGCDDGLFCTLDRCVNTGGSDVNGNPAPSTGPWPLFPQGAGLCRFPSPMVSGDVANDVGNGTFTVGDACNIGGTSFMAPSTCVEGLVVCNDTLDALLCEGAIGPAVNETCGDGLDNDCDGVVDEGCTGVTCNTDADCAPFTPQCAYGRCNVNNLCVYDGDVIRNGTTPPPPIAGLPCDDGMNCTVMDLCQNDGAVGSPASCLGVVDCDDGVPCHFVNQCNMTSGECIFANRTTGSMPMGCNSTGDSLSGGDLCLINCQCDITDDCVCQDKTDVGINQGGCNDFESCTVDFCNSTDGTCSYENLPSWTSCFLRPASMDPCVVGKCVLNDQTGFSECTPFNLINVGHSEGGCDDLNACTRDFCFVNQTNMEPYCAHDFKPFLGNVCDDADDCTTNDLCRKEGNNQTGFTAWCKGDPLVCDDGKECTNDTCVNPGGCLFVPRGTNISCSFSGDPCDGGQCIGSHCVATPVDCSDRLPCEAGTCITGQCQYTFTGNTCDDNDECTFGDLCRRGTCQGTQPNCDDANPCTDDSCNSITGQCEHIANAMNTCTDNDPCTIDACNPRTGQCDHTAIVCPDTDPANQCTTDTCTDQQGLAVCVLRSVADRTPCDDQDLCTSKDECWNGDCEGVVKDCDDHKFCNGPETCDPQTGRCLSGVPPVCDDQDACTEDTCSNDLKACVNTDNPLIGQACGLSSTFPCQLGWLVCNSTTGDVTCHGNRDPTAEVCDAVDNNCNGVIDEGCGVACNTNAHCASLQDLPCWDAVCNVTSNTCIVIATHNPCDDLDACTQDDQCNWGQCLGDPVPCFNPSPCVSSACNVTTGVCEDTILAGRRCENGDPCDVFDTCQPVTGECLGTRFGCSDGNPCTDDSCNSSSGQCEHTNNMNTCDDGDSCSINDACKDSECVGDARQCPPPRICHTRECDPSTQNGLCVEEPLPHGTPCDSADMCQLWTKCRYGDCVGVARDCDDGNPCTDDSCDPTRGCVHVFNAEPCDDNNPCTQDDQCATGRCDGTPIDCSSPNPCVTGLCDPANGVCLEVDNSAKCDDGDACTVCDRCKSSHCSGWPVECDDGNFCNGFETCVNGTCLFGTPPNCNDANPCTQDLCDENGPGCVNPPLSIIGTLCGSSDVGECRLGLVKCDGITGQTHCSGNVEPQAEVCDGLDNNCNGVVDEGCGATCVSDADCAPLECFDVVCTIDNECHYTANHDPCRHWNPCVVDPQCYNGACQGAFKDCSHPNPCVDGVCDGRTGNCVYSNNTDSCDDGDACTFFDGCVSSECVGHARSCNDGNPCTDDSCNSRTGQCMNIINSLPCDDGDGCTSDDTCVRTECVGTEILCLAASSYNSNECSTRVCNPSTGQCEVVFANHNVECDATSNDPCATWGKCFYGECVAVMFKNCNDGDPCTDDSCDSMTGQCLNVFNTAPCDDGDKCTDADRCSYGECGGTSKTCTSTNPCRSGYCDHVDGECKFINNSDRCNDGNPCTLGDRCAEAECKGASEVNCDDGWFCNGAETCSPYTGQCLPGTPPVCEDNDPCTMNQCSNDLKMCVFPRLAEEGNPCGVSDVGECEIGWLECRVGQLHCVGNVDPAPQEGCDGRDNNCNGVVDEGCGRSCVNEADCPDAECMDKHCDVTNTCRYTANRDPCTHSNPCIVGEACYAGACQGSPMVCDDGDPCTHNYCDPNDGVCKFIFTTNPCDDGDECSAFDACNGRGGCYGTRRTCEDNDDCTVDQCNPRTGLCEFTPATVGTRCDDWDPCTTGDQCDSQSHCRGEPKDCDDRDPCTVDTCDPWNSGKCEHTPGNLGSACDDLDACTEHDQCQAGSLCAGVAVDCDDGDVCTDNTCVAGSCQSTFNTEACDDGNPCTDNDRCSTGECLGIAKDCSTGDPCISGHCDAHTGQCVQEFNSDPCDDNDPCTEHDHCEQSECAGDAIECDDGWFCNGPETCDPQTGRCLSGVPPDCNDYDPCTVDSCSNDEKKCIHRPLAGIGDECGVSDVGQCQFGVQHCNPGTGDLFCLGNVDPAPREGCDGRDNNCNGVIDEGCGDTCVTSSDCEPVECFDAICTSQNLCRLIPNSDPCDDGDLCTGQDQCYLGRCRGEHIDCSDDDDCTDEFCNRYTGECEEEFNDDPCDDHDKCTVHDKCNRWTGECAGTPLTCNDGNPCTDEECNPATGQCVFHFNRETCDDENPCTENDQCNGSGGCVGAPKDCDDDNPCTEDFCGLRGQCLNVPANDGGVCDDGLFCTVDDRCLRAKCVGQRRDCDDSNQCTDDVCDDEVDRCVNTPHLRYCNDSNPCTVRDQCNHYALCEGEEKDCSNPNPCITSYCNATSGQCVNVYNSEPCDDGKHCTLDDKCCQGYCVGEFLNCTDGLFCNGEESCSEAYGGICVLGRPPVCDDYNPCTVDFCNDTAGECQSRPRAEIGTECGFNAVGECKLGHFICNPRTGELTCAGHVRPVEEICDNRDNDCDGIVDEGCGVTCGNVTDCPERRCQTRLCLKNMTCAYFKVINETCVPTIPDCGDHGWLVVDPTQDPTQDPHEHIHLEHQCLCRPGWAGENCTECARPRTYDQRYLCHKTCDKDCAPMRRERPPHPWTDWLSYYIEWEAKWGGRDDDGDEDWTRNGCFYKLVVVPEDDVDHFLEQDDDDDEFERAGRRGLDCECRRRREVIKFDRPVEDFELNKVQVDDDDNNKHSPQSPVYHHQSPSSGDEGPHGGHDTYFSSEISSRSHSSHHGGSNLIVLWVIIGVVAVILLIAVAGCGYRRYSVTPRPSGYGQQHQQHQQSSSDQYGYHKHSQVVVIDNGVASAATSLLPHSQQPHQQQQQQQQESSPPGTSEFRSSGSGSDQPIDIDALKLE